MLQDVLRFKTVCQRTFSRSAELCFKTSPGAKYFKWKWVLLTSAFSWKSNSSWCEWNRAWTDIETKAKASSELILRKSLNRGMGPNFFITTTLTFFCWPAHIPPRCRQFSLAVHKSSAADQPKSFNGSRYIRIYLSTAIEWFGLIRLTWSSQFSWERLATTDNNTEECGRGRNTKIRATFHGSMIFVVNTLTLSYWPHETFFSCLVSQISRVPYHVKSPCLSIHTDFLL